MSCIPTAARTVQVVPQDKAVVWEGWGTSLAWFGHALGHNPSTCETVCQLLFSKNHGLGLNIVRCVQHRRPQVELSHQDQEETVSSCIDLTLAAEVHVRCSIRCACTQCWHAPHVLLVLTFHAWHVTYEGSTPFVLKWQHSTRTARCNHGDCPSASMLWCTCRYNIGGANQDCYQEYRAGGAVPCLLRPDGTFDWCVASTVHDTETAG